MQLWRPVGLKELALVFDSGMRAFPPRLPEQPIFYPVLNSSYAEQIARDWNAKEIDAAGYVTAFSVRDDFVNRYERRTVGGAKHEELWVPAEELIDFNGAIEGTISVSGAFFGESYKGWISENGSVKGKDAKQQYTILAKHLSYSSFDVWCELGVNSKMVFINYPYWRSLDAESIGLTKKESESFISFVRRRWNETSPSFSLPEPSN